MSAEASVTQPAEPAPERIGDYRVDRLLANGAMGAVYLVRSPILQRREVLKVLNPALAVDDRMLARFHREADITASLEHPNIVRVYSRGDTSGQQWIAMEYVDGSDAETALRSAGPMPASRVAHILTDIGRALDAAHRDGVVHQDIKPSNILLGTGEPERVVLSDFGAALTSEAADDYARGPMTATLAYTAPEVVTGGPIDGRADVYSLGCTAFRLLTGQRPFPGQDDAAAMIRAHLDTPPPKISAQLPWATTELDTALTTAMAKDPARRYRTAGQFAAAMRRALQAQIATETITPARGPGAPLPPSPELENTPPTPWSSPAAATEFLDELPRTQPVSSHRRRLALAGLAAVIGTAGLAAGLGLSGRTEAPDSGNAHTAATNDSRSSTQAAPTADPMAAARLAAVLPAGYPPGRCTPTTPTQPGATAQMSCGQNVDPDGPPAATYTLARDRAALQDLFTVEIGKATTVVCPGNIASPGAWYHLVAPTVPVGTVYCGLHADRRPVVVWTTDDALLLSVVEADNPDAPTLAQLYTWWTAHS